MREIPIRPKVGIFRIFEAVDYKAWFALSEFVDNSLQSHVDSRRDLGPDIGRGHVTIEFSPTEGGYISIRDDAGGIPQERFEDAFEVGQAPPDTSGLSVYGIGMKSAAAWFANSFRVTTSAYGEPVERIVEFNFPDIIREDTEVLDVIERETDPERHGTEILLRDLKNPIQPRTSTKVREHLASIYRNFLRDDNVSIIYQGDSLAYSDPDILESPYFKDDSGPVVRWQKPIDITLTTGERLHGFAAIRAIGRTAGSGMSLYREGRVITGLDDDPWRPTEIFGFGNSFRSQRVFGELHLENVKVAYSKNGFVWQASEEELIERLKEALDSNPLPLLKQAEGHRSREPEPRQREAATKAFSAATNALEATLKDELAKRVAEPLTSAPGKTLPADSEELISRVFSLVYDRKTWEVTIELAENQDADWITLSDENVTDELLEIRRLGIRLNLNTAFMRRFGGTDAPDIEALFRVATAIAVAIMAAREQGVSFVDSVLDHINKLLKGSLGSR